jgi:hypothetical protein
MERYRFVYEILSCRTWRGASPCSQRASGQLLDGRSKRAMTREYRKRVNESACLLNKNADSGALWHRIGIAHLVLVFVPPYTNGVYNAP